MPKINLLDLQTSNLIAAGEVVERPANVLKELLENSIDAKSTSITTEIEGGGVDLIRITDNGCGMDKEDLPLSIRRHATSKIRNGNDLDAISTLGFRGEALAAISSTSRFTIMSKQKGSDIGHQFSVEGDTVLGLEECGCADGTTIIVRDLFFNQPARRKFLKKAQTENAAVYQYLQRIAISHPEISFRHSVDGIVKLQTVGNGKLSDCIYSVYGKEFFSSLVPLSESPEGYRVYGYITRPEMARNNHSYQSFYVNSRFVKSKTMQFAMEDAYKSFVKSEKFPGCVIFLQVPADEVDVNVHPAKLEVRFRDERAVYQAIFQTVRKTLSSLSNRLARDEYANALERLQSGESVELPKIKETKSTPSVSEEVKMGSFSENKYDLPLFSSAPSRGKSPLIPKEETSFSKTVLVQKVDFSEKASKEESFDPTKSVKTPVQSEKESFPSQKEEQPVPPKQSSNLSLASVQNETRIDGGTKNKKQDCEIPEQFTLEGILPETKNEDNPLTEAGVIRGTLFNAFILYETKDSIYVIDKHAAHERILYEQLKKNHRSESVQLLLEPNLLTLSPMESASLSQHLSELEKAGFLLEEFGESAFLIRGIPLEFTSLSSEELTDLLTRAAKELQLGGKASGAAEKRFDRTLYSMACKAAIKAGIFSGDSDHEWLIQKIRTIDNITVCPHGRPILVSFTKKEVEGWFLRT